MKTLRLRCLCGRNLADVTHPAMPVAANRPAGAWVRRGPDRTPDGLYVRPRPGVDQTTHEHQFAGETQSRYRSLTYTWRCHCGDTPTLRHDSIGELWQQHDRAVPRRDLAVVYV